MLLGWWVIAASLMFVSKVDCQLLAREVIANSCLPPTWLLTDCEGHAVVAFVDTTRTDSATLKAAWELIAQSRSIVMRAFERAQRRTIAGSQSVH